MIGVEELVAVPARGQRAGLRLSVAHHHQSDQVGVVVDRPKSVRYAVAQFATLVDAARGFRGSVAADTAWEGELLEEALHPGLVFTLVRVDLGIRSLKICLGQYRRCTVSRPRDIDRVEVVLVDEPVEVDVGEALTGVRSPVAQQPRLGVLQAKRLPEQRVGLQVQHTQTEIEAGAPVRVDLS